MTLSSCFPSFFQVSLTLPCLFPGKNFSMSMSTFISTSMPQSCWLIPAPRKLNSTPSLLFLFYFISRQETGQINLFTMFSFERVKMLLCVQAFTRSFVFHETGQISGQIKLVPEEWPARLIHDCSYTLPHRLCYAPSQCIVFPLIITRFSTKSHRFYSWKLEETESIRRPSS